MLFKICVGVICFSLFFIASAVVISIGAKIIRAFKKPDLEIKDDDING